MVPLSQRSGIVEWCEGTTPLGEYLVGPPGKPFQGAHSRYRPQDWVSIECRKKLMVNSYLSLIPSFFPSFSISHSLFLSLLPHCVHYSANCREEGMHKLPILVIP